MIGQVFGLLILVALTIYAMTRSWTCFQRPGETKYSRHKSIVMSIIFGLIGTYCASCLYRQLMELMQ